MAIVAAVAEAHGGSATAEGRSGGGLVVTVTLPLGASFGTRQAKTLSES